MPKGVKIDPELQAEIVCTYVECGGNFKATEEKLKANGFNIGYGAIYNFVKRNPKAERLTERFFTDGYEKQTYRRLGSVSASEIQKYLERTIPQIEQAGTEYLAEALRPGTEGDAARMHALAECHKRLIDGAKQMAFIAQRFRDGIHQKAAPAVEQKFDNSSHKTDILNFGERLPEGGYDVLRAHADKLKSDKTNRIAGIPLVKQGGNGATP